MCLTSLAFKIRYIWVYLCLVPESASAGARPSRLDERWRRCRLLRRSADQCNHFGLCTDCSKYDTLICYFDNVGASRRFRSARDFEACSTELRNRSGTCALSTFSCCFTVEHSPRKCIYFKLAVSSHTRSPRKRKFDDVKSICFIQST
jgi:hypothetical protein